MVKPDFYPALQSPEDFETLSKILRKYGGAVLLQDGILVVGVENVMGIKDLIPTE